MAQPNVDTTARILLMLRTSPGIGMEQYPFGHLAGREFSVILCPREIAALDVAAR